MKYASFRLQKDDFACIFVFQKTILSMFFIFREKILIIYNSSLILAQNLKRTLSVLYLSAVNYGRYTVDIRQIYVRYTIDKYRSTIGILPHLQQAERCPIALMGVHYPENSDFFRYFLAHPQILLYLCTRNQPTPWDYVFWVGWLQT